MSALLIVHTVHLDRALGSSLKQLGSVFRKFETLMICIHMKLPFLIISGRASTWLLKGSEMLVKNIYSERKRGKTSLGYAVQVYTDGSLVRV